MCIKLYMGVEIVSCSLYLLLTLDTWLILQDYLSLLTYWLILQDYHRPW